MIVVSVIVVRTCTIRAIIVDRGHFSISIENTATDVSNRRRDGELCQTCAAGKGVIANGLDGLGDHKLCKLCAILKCLICNGGNSVARDIIGDVELLTAKGTNAGNGTGVADGIGLVCYTVRANEGDRCVVKSGGTYGTDLVLESFCRLGGLDLDDPLGRSMSYGIDNGALKNDLVTGRAGLLDGMTGLVQVAGFAASTTSV